MEIKASIETITPSKCEEYLRLNDNYRARVVANIEAMAKDMKARRWDENGESIKFSADGRLVDGQNRLMACIKAGVPFTTVVVRGVKSDLNIDTGNKRQFRDWLKHNGCEKYCSEVAAGIRLSIPLSKGLNPNGAVGDRRPTAHELKSLWKKHPEFVESAAVAMSVSHILRSSIGTATHFLFNKKDSELCGEFFAALNGKLELVTSDPVVMLRSRLLLMRSTKAHNLDTSNTSALVILAWNYWRRGLSVKHLAWRASGPHAQAFPVIE